jgi:hypothetical protein
MDAAIRQAINTELMVLSNARLLDSTRSKQTGRRQETNQAKRNTRGTNNNNRNNRSRNSNQKLCDAYTGPNMVMESVCVLALLIGPNSPKLRKISFSSLRNRDATLPWNLLFL